VRNLNAKAYIARTAMNNMKHMKECLEKAIQAQRDGNFSMVEVLSFCPTNWRTFGPKTNEYLERMKEHFKLGEF